MSYDFFGEPVSPPVKLLEVVLRTTPPGREREAPLLATLEVIGAQQAKELEDFISLLFAHLPKDPEWRKLYDAPLKVKDAHGMVDQQWHAMVLKSETEEAP